MNALAAVLWTSAGLSGGVLLAPRRAVEACLAVAGSIALGVVSTAYVLSALGALGSAEAWLAGALAWAGVLGVWAGARRGRAGAREFARALAPPRPVRSDPFATALLAVMAATAVVLFGCNAALGTLAAPGNWDGMTYHLARAAYAVQTGSFAPFGANYWAQQVHPKNSAALLVAALTLGGKTERLVALPQLVAYVVCGLEVYGLGRLAGLSRAEALFGALAFGLLVEPLMEAATVQNDLVLAAAFGAALYFLALFGETRRWAHAAASALAVGFGLGVKAAFALVVPLVAAFAVFVMWRAGGWRVAGRAAALFAVVAGAMVLPVGYVSNVQRFGHPVGPESVRAEHAFEAMPAGAWLRLAATNAVRFALDFVELDGIPETAPVVHDALGVPKRAVGAVAAAVGLDPAGAAGTREPFAYQAPYRHEDFSGWGVLGFLLVWPAVWVALLRRATPPVLRVLAGLAVAFVLVQAAAGPYDPWRGRYFIACAVVAAPACGPVVRARSWWGRGAVVAVVALGAALSVAAVLLRSTQPMVAVGPLQSVWSKTRTEQLASSRMELIGPLARFERLVPPGATVALALPLDSYEYPYFGAGLTRRLLPVRPFDGPVPPVPAAAGYLLYQRGEAAFRAGDVPLGADLYLRRLAPAGRP